MALIIGGIGGALVVFAVPLLDKLKIDDVVGAISAHLVAGIWGTLAVGLLGGGDLVAQIQGIVAIGVFMVVPSSGIWWGLRPTVGRSEGGRVGSGGSRQFKYRGVAG